MSKHRNLSVAVRLLCIPLLAGMAACQTMGSGAEQRAFVAAHIVRYADQGSTGAVYIGQDGAFARPADSAPVEVAAAAPRP